MLKKTLLLLLVGLGTLACAKPTVVVSVLPEQTFVKKIAGDMVDVTVMVQPGGNPHTYEPKPSQMAALSKADVYFSIGVEFEEVWLPKFKAQNKELRFVDISEHIEKIRMSGHHHEHEDDEEHGEHEHEGDEGHGEHHHHHDGLDPHTWTAPQNVAVMAHNIFDTLTQIDPENRERYRANLDEFLNEIAATDAKIKAILKNVSPGTRFMVFHPAWGYFAQAYGLEEVAIEVEGKNPKPKEIIMIIDEAKEEKVKIIFAQPEFSDKSAKVIAEEAGVRVEKISPLSADWSDNLIDMATLIAK